MYRLNDPVSLHYDRQQMIGDLHALRELAEEQSLHDHPAPPGPYELSVDLQALDEVSERLTEMVEAQMEAAGEHSLMLMHQVEGERQTRLVLEDLLEVQANNLLVTGAVALATSGAVDRLDYIADAIDESNEWLEDIDCGIFNISNTLERIEEGLHEVGDDICREIRVSGRRAAKFLARRMTALSEAALRYQYEIAVSQERSAQQRHEELLRAVTTPLSNKAEEKYRQAMVQYQTRHFGLCARELREVFRHDSTHVLAWVLYGRLCSRRGQPALARAAYQRAVSYAAIAGNYQSYTVAVLSLSRLECLVGNWKRAQTILRDACQEAASDQTAFTRLLYEQMKTVWCDPERVIPASSMKSVLEAIFMRDPNLRDEVARTPAWTSLFEDVWYLRFGNAPYLELARRWYELQNDISRRLLILTGDRWQDQDVLLPCGHARTDVYRLVLELTDGGRESLPEAVSDHLQLLAQAALQANTAGAYGFNGQDDEFIAGHEQTVLHVASELFRLQRTQEAQELLRCTDQTWNHNGNCRMVRVSIAHATGLIYPF